MVGIDEGLVGVSKHFGVPLGALFSLILGCLNILLDPIRFFLGHSQAFEGIISFLLDQMDFLVHFNLEVLVFGLPVGLGVGLVIVLRLVGHGLFKLGAELCVLGLMIVNFSGE